MNRLESTVAILDIQAENLMSAESRISDVDVATEMAAIDTDPGTGPGGHQHVGPGQPDAADWP